MRGRRLHQHNSGIVIRTVSAVVFLAFTVLWLFFFQAEIFAVAQHTLSGGVTYYNRYIGTVVITGVLWILQVFVFKLFPLRNHLHALTYFPSLLALALLGMLGGTREFRTSWMILPLVLFLIWLFIVWTARKMLQYDKKTASGFFSRNMCGNMVIMSLMIMGVAAFSNTDAIYNYRTRVESQLLERQFGDALATGAKSFEADANLTMLRAYALSRDRQMGERLFQYHVVGSSADLVPNTSDSNSELLLYPRDSVYAFLGGIPRTGMTTRRYLAALERGGQAKAAVRDYVLCGYLIDRDLDGFASAIGRYYEVSDSAHLPCHYREALVLYTHRRANPLLVYHHAVTDEDYRNLQELEAMYDNPHERKIRVMEKYYGSYWYYYEYMR